MSMHPIGKRVGQDLYIHVAAIDSVLPLNQLLVVQGALDRISYAHDMVPNVVKIGPDAQRVSLLHYADFNTSPFPELVASWSVRLDGQVTFRSYQDSLNPPILHRKELLVPADWPGRTAWVEVTKLAESIGLFDDSQGIGFRVNWERLVASKGFQIVGETLQPLGNERRLVLSDIDRIDPRRDSDTEIQRHLTALSRVSLSAPVQLLLRAGLLRKV